MSTVRLGIVTVSDRASRGEYEDRGGPAIHACFAEMLNCPWEPVARVIPDERPIIESTLIELCDREGCCLVVTTGGTGPARRDVTPEATAAVCDKILDGFGELMRQVSLRSVPTAILSRQLAGTRGQTLIINLPGKPTAIRECLLAVFPAVPYCIDLLEGPRLTTNDDVVKAFRPQDPRDGEFEMRCWFASIVLLVGAGFVTAQTGDEKKATVAFINHLHVGTGGYTTAGAKGEDAKKASMAATSTAARTLPKFGGALVDPKLDAAFIESCFDRKTGAFADTPGGPGNVHLTAVGLMAVVDMKLPRDQYKPAVAYLTDRCESFEDIRIAAAAFEALQTTPSKKDAWLAKAIADRKNTGVWGEGRGIARQTGSAVALVLRLQKHLPNQSTALRALRDGQHPDGGFGMPDRDDSDLDSTYRVMRAFHMLRERPAEPRRVRQFVAKCRHADGGYGLRPGEPSTLSGVYFAGTILSWLDLPNRTAELDKTGPTN